MFSFCVILHYILLAFIAVDASTTEAEMCELTRLIIRYYCLVCNTHKSLNMLKTKNTIMYWILVFVICLVPIILYLKISGFYESYFFTIVLLLILQYKLKLKWTAIGMGKCVDFFTFFSHDTSWF